MILMDKLYKIVGRILIASVLLGFGYAHLNNPYQYQQAYTNAYQLVYDVIAANNILGQYIFPQPTKIQIYWNFLIKLMGILEGGIGIMFLFGDFLGFFYYGFVVLVSIILTHRQMINKLVRTDSIIQLDYCDGNMIIFLGFALLFWGVANQIAQNNEKKRKE